MPIALLFEVEGIIGLWARVVFMSSLEHVCNRVILYYQNNIFFQILLPTFIVVYFSNNNGNNVALVILNNATFIKIMYKKVLFYQRKN